MEHAPTSVKRFVWRVTDRRFLDPLFTAPFNATRAELGLPLLKRLFHHWIHEADLIMGMFQDWLSPRQPDGPEGLQLTGFPLHDHGHDAPLPPQDAQFLNAGAPPVAFTAGTANAS